MQQARRLLSIVGLAVLGLGLLAEPALARSHATPTAKASATAKAAAEAAAVPATPIVVPTPELLVDMQTGMVLHERDAGVPWHPASLTKLMTAYVTFEAIQQGRVNLDTIVTMSPKAVNEAPARSGLPAGDTLTLKDALYIMLVKSANDMAVAVAETVDGSTDAFVGEMNATAQKLGLTRTHYDNVNGLPDDGQVTTARDLAVLAIDLRRTFPQYDPIFRTQAVMVGKVRLQASNELVSKFEGTDGMKTGYVCGSGLNIVATVNRGGRQLLAVVLGGTSARERDQRAAQMLLNGFSGQLASTGKGVVDIADDESAAPVDMKPLLCGAKARAFVAQQQKTFPMGLRGQQNFLTDKVAPDIYTATDLGRPGGTGPVVAAVPANDNEPAEGDAASDDDPGAPAAGVVAPLPRTSLKRK